jgi:hypothetical protein
MFHRSAVRFVTGIAFGPENRREELAMLYYDSVLELVLITMLVIMMLIANGVLLRGDKRGRR